MHDPMTVAFEIRSPFAKRWGGKSGRQFSHHPTWVTIWHVDPEKGGDDDSCDWFGSAHSRENGWFPAAVDDYTSMMPDSQRAVDFVWWMWRRKLGRPWYKHPRWHFHHWKIQVHALLDLKRFLFSRCAKCGKGFRWGYAPISLQWDGDGPQWFKGEASVYHHECYQAPPIATSAE